MFVTTDKKEDVDVGLINSVFARPGIAIHTLYNPGYQAGAIMALVEGFRNNWFAGYDWVIRVNPDVLIRNDTFISTQMHDPRVSGIFDDCKDLPCPAGNRCLDRTIHTDFFAIRSSAISLDELLRINVTHAEKMATEAFSGIVKNGADSWLPGTGPHNRKCRVIGYASPVIHDHNIFKKCSSGFYSDGELQQQRLHAAG